MSGSALGGCQVLFFLKGGGLGGEIGEVWLGLGLRLGVVLSLKWCLSL